MKLKSALMIAAFGVTSFAGAQQLTGAGSTFIYPILSKWSSQYSSEHPGVQINYQSIGSGGGIKQVSSGTVDFGATDGPMTDQQLKEAQSKIVHIPVVMGAVVPVYNLPGVKTELKFSGDVIAGIYLGEIKNWNDGRIAKDNPGVSLPNQNIFVAHRADGSGTTFIFTDYLSKVSKEWQTKVGKGTAVQWPVGIGGKGNEGVTALVRQTPGAFGYVELIYALQNKILFGSVRNQAGNFVKASPQGVSEAAANVKNMPEDFRVSITDAPGANSYPISGFSWLLIPTKARSAANAKVLKEFVEWILDKGEGEAAQLYYAPLPASLNAKVKQTLNSM